MSPFASRLEIEEPVAGEKREHVVEERNSAMNLRGALAVEV